MDEPFIRMGVVAAAVAAALAIAWLQHRRARRPGRAVADSGLQPGFHYFSSRTCETCLAARAMLDRRLGPDGYTEHTWDEDPPTFQRLGVDEVPALMVVAKDGSARLFAGRLEAGLETLILE